MAPLTPKSPALLGLTGAAFLSGTIASISLIGIPSILHVVNEHSLGPSHAAKLWRATFEAGFKLAPPLALITASSLAFAGWSIRSESPKGKRRKWYFVATALTVGIVPFTIIFMKETNDRLLELAGREGVSGAVEGEIKELLGRWGVLNAARGMLPLVAALVVGVSMMAA